METAAQKGKAPTLSAFLVVYHEERHMRACLESLRGCVDEIVVVHDGPCHDASLDIAREYSARVIEHPRVGNNDPITPFALEQTTGDWVLKIDADERLSPELREGIRALIAREDADAFSLWSPLVDSATGRREERYKKYKRVLFRRKLMYKVGVPHAQNGTRGWEERSDLVLEHHEGNPGSARRLLNAYNRKNMVRSRTAAQLLSGDLDRLPTFHCTMRDTDLRVVRKLLFERRHPLVAMVAVPLAGFVQIYFRQGRWRGGAIGLVDAMNVPLFHFFTCGRILASRLRRRRSPR